MLHRETIKADTRFAITVLCALLVVRVQAQNQTPGPSATDESLAGMSLEQLGNVEVTTASKEPEQVWNTPAAIFVITQEDIQRSGATSIPEALRLAPGVEVARIDSDHWAIGIRGFEGEFSKSLLVLIDGRSVYTPLFSGVYWQVQDTMLEDIDRIEVIRGPGGTIWGANAVDGVINIITKNAKNTYGALATVRGGSLDQGAIEFRYGGGNGNGLDYRVYGKTSTYGPEFHPDGQNFDDWRNTQFGFRSDWTLKNGDTLTVQGDIYKGTDGERVGVSLYSPPSEEVIDGNHHTGGGNVLARWQRKFTGGSDVQLQGYFDRTTRDSPQLGEVRDTVDIDFLHHIPLKWGQDFLWGAGARWSPDDITQKFATLDFEPHKETDSIYSWFLQDQIPLVAKKLALTLGSKFEHNNYSGFEYQPDGRLLWTPTEHQTVWAAVTRSVRTPSRLDQDLQLTDYLETNPIPVFLRVVGTSTFRAEQVIGSELGYRTLISHNLYLNVAIFHNNYRDLYGYGPGTGFVETTPTPTHLVLELPIANALRGDTAGVEVAPDWKPTHWCELKGSYSFLHLEVSDKPGFTDTLNTVSDNGSSPHHEFQAHSLFNLSTKLQLDATYRYVSKLPAQMVDAYGTADLRFGWQLAESWDMSVIGQNLVQPHHAEYGTDVDTIVGIKRAVYAQFTWKR